ncbi:hypothetical protein ACOSQ2_001754 [Xanthoceras sorbifolium]|uniref:Cyclic nucleotide-binding domain-containing protein n=1 Tax=Xanthoceras sorbifolium TaxID=99658 RepID=A0ABQ8IL05_9ROSI|nr:hypothetical protein JRO89_XS01G0242600 [Xanthoceras sorbifolium]
MSKTVLALPSLSSSSALFRPFQRQNQPSFSSVPEGPTTQILLWRYQILDPDSEIVAHWNYVFLIICLVGLFIDPLYFYLPYVGGPACLSSDNSLGLWITFFRTCADLFFLLHMIMKFRTAFVSPSSRVFGRGELVMDSREIAIRYLKSDFIIDLAATLPLPQIVIWLVIPATRDSRADYANSTLALIVLLQYIPRIFVIFPLNQRIIKTTGVVAKTAWSGAAYNLILFMLASHVLGSTYYLLSIGRVFQCWKSECIEENASRILCISSFLDCNSLSRPERQSWQNVTNVIGNCDPSKENLPFKFGIFGDAFQQEAASAGFISKFLFCLWWGFRNLSSYGQELGTTIYLGENFFAILICISGSVLSALLIGNMQNFLQSMTVRLEEWRVKRRDTEEWMRHRQLPPNLQERVRQFVQYKWLATRGVNEESLMRSLPLDLRRDIQRHLCIALIRRVPFFSQMDDQLLDAICERLILSLSTKDTYIVREDDPVTEMVFIIRGQLESSTTNGGRSGFYNSITLRPGDFFGEELLTWALMPSSSLNVPSSTRTVRALCEVEAFALQAEDLKFVAHQFKRLHSKKLQHAFRYYSHQWRTWAACFIQSAWRRFRKRKMANELSRQENSFYYLQLPDEDAYYIDEVTDDANHDEEIGKNSSAHNPNIEHLGVTVLASRFVKNTRRGSAQKAVDPASTSLKMPKLFKPDEPDFSVDNDDI